MNMCYTSNNATIQVYPYKAGGTCGTNKENDSKGVDSTLCLLLGTVSAVILRTLFSNDTIQ